MSVVVDMLNEAFRRDPNAIHALIVNRVPCNQELADDEFVHVDRSPVLLGNHFQVGTLGVVNAVLASLKLPLVASMFSEETDEDGRIQMIGFCEYKPVKETQS